jgi:hypothetical protein
LLTAALTMATLFAAGGAQAETCYRDESGRIVHRRQPGYVEVPCPAAGAPAARPQAAPGEPGAPVPGATPSATGEGPEARTFPDGRQAPRRNSPLPRPQAGDYGAPVPLPDRWRIVEMLPGYKESLFDPYNRNPLKADKPFAGTNPDGGKWFFDLGLISDTGFEYRQLPTGVAGNGTASSGTNDLFGGSNRLTLSQNIATEFVLYRGDTVFQPPTWQLRFTPVFNFNYNSVGEAGLLNVDPRKGTTRDDHFVGLEELFVERRLRVASQRFDFDSLRIGVQPFSSDFRGFLFQDNQLGVRLFGTRDNNVYQYNLAWFRLLDKDTNSGLNTIRRAPRKDDVFVANLYRQDTFVPGFTSQVMVLYNRDRESGEVAYDTNGFIVIPAALGIERARNYDVVYLGYNTDGHIGRYNLTTSLYWAFGNDTPGTFVVREERVNAGFAAAELSRDYSWLRVRLSGLYATGDRNPYGHTETGFDAVFENPQFAGGDTAFWIAQAVPLVGGGGVALTGPNSILNSLRSSKDEGQSNFANPGTGLAGIGADADLLPELRLTLNVNDMYFAQTDVLQAARQQMNIDAHIGFETSLSATYRPLDSQNVVFRGAYSHLFPGEGFRDLFPGRASNYLLVNVVLTY